MKELNKKLIEENAIITQAVKGKTVVIIKSEDYAKKVHQFLTANNFKTLTKDPTNKYQKLIQKKNATMSPDHRQVKDKMHNPEKTITTSTQSTAKTI